MIFLYADKLLDEIHQVPPSILMTLVLNLFWNFKDIFAFSAISLHWIGPGGWISIVVKDQFDFCDTDIVVIISYSILYIYIS